MAKAAKDDGGPARTTAPTILVADDDPDILSMLSVRLGKRGYQVLEAQDGLQALSLARQHRPDLLVLDIMMPGMDGWEVARELRADRDLHEVGILVLTAIGEKVNEMTSPLHGADEYLDKPFEFTDLETKIRAILDRRGRKGPRA